MPRTYYSVSWNLYTGNGKVKPFQKKQAAESFRFPAKFCGHLVFTSPLAMRRYVRENNTFANRHQINLILNFLTQQHKGNEQQQQDHQKEQL